MHVGPLTTRICEPCNDTLGHAFGMAKFLVGLRERFAPTVEPEPTAGREPSKERE